MNDFMHKAIIWVKHYTPTWSALSRIGQSSIAKSAYMWLWVVPLTAKLLSQVNSRFPITIFGHTFNLTLGLPFSWKLLFLASFLTSIGNLLFSFFCPKLITDFRDYISFRDTTGSSPYTLFRLYYQVYEACLRREGRMRNAATFLSNYFTLEDGCAQIVRGVSQGTPITDEIEEYFETSVFHGTKTFRTQRDCDAFEFARAFADKVRSGVRFMVSFLYGTAGFIVVFLAYQNAMTVLNYTSQQ